MLCFGGKRIFSRIKALLPTAIIEHLANLTR